MLYTSLRFIFRLFFSLIGRWKINGVSNIPLEGPVVVVSNHVSNWDPLIIGCALNRKIHFMAKAELFAIPIIKNIIPKMGAFPIKRGQTDRNALRIALKLLKENELIGMFPEGTRGNTREMLPFKPGVTMIAYKAQCPILPVALVNSRKVLSGWINPVEVRIGKPIEIPFGDKNEKKSSGEIIDDITQKSRQAIQDLLSGATNN